MHCSDSKGLGQPGEEFAEGKGFAAVKPSLRERTSQLLSGGSVAVAIVASRAPENRTT
jgi:hypothetical protein